jgi:hypothetical protein
VRAVQILLGAPTIGRGSAWAEGGGGRSQRSQLCPHATQNVQKRPKTGDFVHFFAYKSPKIPPFFTQKYLTRYTTEMFFEACINLKFFNYLRHCGLYLNKVLDIKYAPS